MSLTTMRINYRLDVDSADYDLQTSGAENVIYHVNYTLWVWTGSTKLEDEIRKQSDQKDSRGNVIPMRTVIQHRFGVDFDPPSTANEEGFVDLSELTEDDLTNWILRKWNHKRIQEMDMFKAAINILKSREGKSRRDFKSKQGYINA